MGVTTRITIRQYSALEQAIKLIEANMGECHNKDVAVNIVHSEVEKLKQLVNN